MDAGGIFWLCAICPVACRVLAILQSSCADGWIPALPCHVALAHRSRSVSLILQEPNTCCPWAWNMKGQQDARQQQKALIQKAMKRVLFSLFSVLVLMALHSREVHPVTSWLLPQMVPPKPAHRQERAPSKTLAGRAVTTPWSASTCKSPGPNTSQPRKRSSFAGRLPPPRSLLTHGAATLFALPCPDASHRFALPHRKLFTSTARPWQFGDSPVCSRIITSISSSRLF